MNRLTCTRLALLCLLLPLIRAATTLAQETTAKEAKLPAPRQISLDEAVQLALKHNHVVRISQFKVEEKQHTRISRAAPTSPSCATTAISLSSPTRNLSGFPPVALASPAAHPSPVVLLFSPRAARRWSPAAPG